MSLTDLLHRLRPGRHPADCHEVAARLQAFLDGEVVDRRHDAIAAHLADCRRCGLEADTYRAVKDALRQGRREVPPGTVERLRSFSEGLQ